MSINMSNDKEQSIIEMKIKDLGVLATKWTDEEFATKIVAQLVLDKGVVNNWQRTIEFMLKVAKEREAQQPLAKAVAKLVEVLKVPDEYEHSDAIDFFYEFITGNDSLEMFLWNCDVTYLGSERKPPED